MGGRLVRPQRKETIEARARRASGVALLWLAGAALLGGVTAQAETVRNDLRAGELADSRKLLVLR